MNTIVKVLVLCCAAVAVSAELKNRIFQGTKARDGEFPYQVELRGPTDFQCGGALISDRHVLTAAHCVEDYIKRRMSARYLTVKVGSTFLNHGTTYQVRRMAHHRGYTKYSAAFIPNDIAVIHLATPVSLSARVRPIALPQPNYELPDNSPVTLTGWGKTEGSRLSNELLVLQARTVSYAECQKALKYTITLGNVCAKGVAYASNSCNGDSGGPLVDASKRTVIGIVSGGTGFCGNGAPDVYTKVAYFLPFINEEMHWDPRKPNANPAVMA